MSLGQQLKLQGTTCIHMGRWSRDFSGHFQTQQSVVSSTLRSGLQGLTPSLTLRGRHPAAQFFGGRQLFGLALLPCGHQVHQGFAMGLHGQATQGVVGLLQGMALSAESGVAQARSTRFKRIAAARRIGATARSGSVWSSTPGRAVVAPRTRFVTKPPSGCGLGFLLARTVIASHRHHFFGWRRGFDYGGWFSCNFDRSFCCNINRCF